MVKTLSKSGLAKKVESELRGRGLDKLVKNFARAFPRGEIFLVGGVVRDILISREKKGDFDFVVRNVSAADLKRFLKKHGTVNLVGKTFGVFKFRPAGYKNNEFIDFALPRTEHALGTGG